MSDRILDDFNEETNPETNADIIDFSKEKETLHRMSFVSLIICLSWLYFRFYHASTILEFFNTYIDTTDEPFIMFLIGHFYLCIIAVMSFYIISNHIKTLRKTFLFNFEDYSILLMLFVVAWLPICVIIIGIGFAIFGFFYLFVSDASASDIAFVVSAIYVFWIQYQLSKSFIDKAEDTHQKSLLKI